jgi:excinuclease UvrABC nuclease subunit
MQQHTKKLEFEKALELKEDILAIEILKQNQIIRDVI